MATIPQNTEDSQRKLPGRVLISAAQGARATGVAESTWWEWARTIPDFPTPIRISARCTRWDEAEITAWLETRRDA